MRVRRHRTSVGRDGCDRELAVAAMASRAARQGWSPTCPRSRPLPGGCGKLCVVFRISRICRLIYKQFLRLDVVTIQHGFPVADNETEDFEG